MVPEFLIIIVILYFLYLRWSRRRKIECYKQFRNDITSIPGIGHAYMFIGNGEAKMKSIETLSREALKQGGVIHLQNWIFDIFYIMVAEPETAETILKNCLEKDANLKLFTPIFGSSLFVSSVPEWRLRRKVLNPAFIPRNLNQFLGIFNKNSAFLAEKLQNIAKTGAFSIYEHLTAYSLDSIFESIYGYEIGAQRNPRHPVMHAFVVCCELVSNRMLLPWLHNETVYRMTSQYTMVKKNADLLFKFIDEKILKKCKEIKSNTHSRIDDLNQSTREQKKTILELMIESSSKAKESLSDAYLREETFLVTFAGMDTTSVSLSFLLTMLARHPDIQEKVYNEIMQVLGDSKKPIEAEDLSQLHYTEAVIKETLRLYPPGVILLRKVDKDIVLPSGKYLVAGTGVMVNVWAIHRNPLYWGEDADTFRPERFLEAVSRHPAAFLPFSYGVRNCIGAQYAMMSLKTSIATLIRQYRVLPADVDPGQGRSMSSECKGPEPLRLQFDIMIRDVENFTMRFVART